MERTIPRIVVTGLGAVTPIGNDVDSFWAGLLEGRNGVAHVSLPDSDDLPVQIAAEVDNFDPELYLDRRSVRRSGRFVQLATAASMQAMTDSGYPLDSDGGDEVGVVMASSGDAFNMGEPWGVLKERGAKRVDPLLITRHGQHMAAARVARELGLRGPNTTINTACASGTDALGHALNLLRLGHARALLAGGAEAMVTQLALASMGKLGALSQNNRDPEHASRPFDRDRDGFILGEGAGVLMLEREEDALARGARIYAELAGVGWSFDATDDAAPDAEGQSLAITRALRDADTAPRGCGIHQRTRHEHPAQRPHGDGGDQARTGYRRRAAHRDLIDKVDDRTPRGWRGWHRGRQHGALDRARGGTADDQLRHARPGLRPRHRAE